MPYKSRLHFFGLPLFLTTLFAVILFFARLDSDPHPVVPDHSGFVLAPAPSPDQGGLIAIWTDNPPPAVPPPAAFDPAAAADSQLSLITVTYVGSWPAEAKNAFNYAVAIWEQLLIIDIPIVIEAEWAPLPTGVLGGAGPTSFAIDGTNTYYPIALGNQLAGSDLNGGNPEINAIFSSSFGSSWYFGTDLNPGFFQYDFVSVVLHEIGHGIGFFDSMDVNGGVGAWLGPVTFDRLIINGSSQPLIGTFPNNSAVLASQLTSNNLFFNGSAARSFNGGAVPQLYAPNPYEPGSSIAHLDDDFPGTINDLMTPFLANGTAHHNPGPVTLGIMTDIGWLVRTDPVFATPPTLLLEKDSSKNNALFLPDLVTAGAPSNTLTYSVISVSNGNLSATIDGGNYLDLTALNGFVGQVNVVVEADAGGGSSSQATIPVVVAEELYLTQLPLIRR